MKQDIAAGGTMERRISPGQSLMPKRTLEQWKATRKIAGLVIDSFPSNSAIVDEHGVIRVTNRAWREFARVHNMEHPEAIGMNYLNLADSATGICSEMAREAANGIKEVLKGFSTEVIVDYPCKVADEQRWFRMHATPVKGLGPLRVVISHHEINAETFQEDRIEALEKELKFERANQESVRTALKVLLQRREEERRETEERVLSGIRQALQPHLDKLHNTRLDSDQKRLVSAIQAQLHTLATQFGYNLAAKHLNLTPQEINVANLILDGKATKEIADALNISMNAIEFHRKNIRKKLGIRNKRVSLRCRLLSLEPSCVHQQFNMWKTDRR
ncbi:MAG: hypothetical protein HY912_16900 [Desulfomonile tiedjei]|uniref:HTH luxR-type domain-containing protein n=1 Tax=Desulfomonile tiedjei TaxID=2358 RepID=A0A9D6V5D8_9BACT|nr:hypothetical protein [Desulfomonile tiedjei]